jgi:hypothetical protein
VYAPTKESGSSGAAPANGITGIREWTPADSPTGVRVTTTESFAGDPVAADIANMQALLDQSLQSWLQHLKDAAERG